jgi:hypothetical protein
MSHYDTSPDVSAYFGKCWLWRNSQWAAQGVKFTDEARGIVDNLWLQALFTVAAKHGRTDGVLATVGRFVFVNEMKKLIVKTPYIARSIYTEMAYDKVTMELSRLHHHYKKPNNRPYQQLVNWMHKWIRQTFWQGAHHTGRAEWRRLNTARTTFYRFEVVADD